MTIQRLVGSAAEIMLPKQKEASASAMAWRAAKVVSIDDGPCRRSLLSSEQP